MTDLLEPTASAIKQAFLDTPEKCVLIMTLARDLNGWVAGEKH